MAKPLILWSSVLRNSGITITDPGTASGFSIQNIINYRPWSIWKSDTTTSPINIDIDFGGTAQSNYILMVNHNLNTLGASVEVFKDTVFPPVVSAGSFSPGEDTVTYNAITNPGARRYWRITITSGGGPFASAPFIGEIFSGGLLNLPQYMAPTFDPFFTQIEAEGSRSRGGHYLGASLRGKQHRGEFTFGEAGAPRADFTSDLNAFIDQAMLRRPFGFVLDTADSDFAVARYLKVPDDAQIRRQAVGGSWQNLTFTMPVEEAYMEPAV